MWLEADIPLAGAPGRECIVLCVMPPAARYRAMVNGAEVRSRVLGCGAVEISIPNASRDCHLVVW